MGDTGSGGNAGGLVDLYKGGPGHGRSVGVHCGRDATAEWNPESARRVNVRWPPPGALAR